MPKRNFAQLNSEHQEQIAAKELNEVEKRARIEEEILEEETHDRIEEEMLEEMEEISCDFAGPSEEYLKLALKKCAFRLYTLVLSLGQNIQKILMLIEIANFISDSDPEQHKAELPSPSNVESSENDLSSADNDEELQRPIEVDEELEEAGAQQEPIEAMEEEARAPIEEEIFEEESSDEEMWSDDETSDFDDSFTEEPPNIEITEENCSVFDVYTKTQAHKQNIQKLLDVLKQKKIISDSEFERYEAKLQFNYPLPSNDVAAIEDHLASLDDDGEVIQQEPIAAEGMEEEGARALIVNMLAEETSDSTDSLFGGTVDKEITPENCTFSDIQNEIIAFQHILYKILETLESKLPKTKSKEELEQPVVE